MVGSGFLEYETQDFKCSLFPKEMSGLQLSLKHFFFPFQTELNSTSFFPNKELAEATQTLLDSLGTLAQEVRLLTIIYFDLFLNAEFDKAASLNIIGNIKPVFEA